MKSEARTTAKEPAKPAASESDARRRILEAAIAHFARRGSQATPIQALLDPTGLSKGAFYHHFASKEQLLDAVADIGADHISRTLLQQLPDRSAAASERLSALLTGLAKAPEKADPPLRRLLAALHRPDNLELRQRLLERRNGRLQGALTSILRQGIDEGHFRSPWPAASARLLLEIEASITLWTQQRSEQLRGNASRQRAAERAGSLLRHSVERLLDAAEGSLA